MDRQVAGERQAGPSGVGAAILRHRRGRALVHLRRDVWYLGTILGGIGEHHQGTFRHATGCHRQGARPGQTHLLPDGQERTLHQSGFQLGEAQVAEHPPLMVLPFVPSFFPSASPHNLSEPILPHHISGSSFCSRLFSLKIFNIDRPLAAGGMMRRSGDEGRRLPGVVS